MASVADTKQVHIGSLNTRIEALLERAVDGLEEQDYIGLAEMKVLVELNKVLNSCLDRRKYQETDNWTNEASDDDLAAEFD